MKLRHIQEARYHRSPIIDIVNKATEKLLTKGNDSDEEYGTEIPDANREQIVRDMDSVYDRAEYDEPAHEDGEEVWVIKHLDDAPNGVKLEATLYTTSTDKTYMVLYKF